MPDTVSEARVVFAEELLRSVRQMTYVLVTLSIPVILLLVFAGVTILPRGVRRSGAGADGGDDGFSDRGRKPVR